MKHGDRSLETSNAQRTAERETPSFTQVQGPRGEVKPLLPACRCNGYRGIPVHLLLGPVIGPSSAQGRTNNLRYGEDPHEEAPREENDDGNR
jgi:hypothetical protein